MAGALLLGFEVKLGLVRRKYLLAGLHAAEASHVSASSLSAFRGAIVRSVWSSKMPVANTPAVLNLLDGGPDEVPRIFRMLDLIAHGAEEHGPVHLLLISAAELGFAWDGREQNWVGAALAPLGMLSGPVQHFHEAKQLKK